MIEENSIINSIKTVTERERYQKIYSNNNIKCRFGIDTYSDSIEAKGENYATQSFC